MFDIVIIGGGVIGCSIAHELSKYKLKTILIEKDNDLCSGTSSANSAIVHSGYDPEPGTSKASLNVEGNKAFPQLCKELDVPFIQDGSLTVACSKEEMETIHKLLDRAVANGVPAKILTKDEVLAMEPNLNKDIEGALFAPTCAIVNPFELTVALMENAMDNGVEFKLNCEVASIAKVGDHYVIKTKDGQELEAKLVINAAGVYADRISNMMAPNSLNIKPRKGEYFVLDHFNPNFVKHTLFMVPSDKGKGVLISPTTSGNYIIGPSSEWVDDKEDVSTEKDILEYVRGQAKRLIENIPYQNLIREYSGLRAVSDSGEFIIESLTGHEDFINVAGIQSPGLASSPAISLKVMELVGKVMKMEKNNAYNPNRKPVVRFASLSPDEKVALIKKNSLYGHIVCRCEKISEAEIMDCINRNAGATTVKGVKKRCRPGFGKCQGTFCEPQVVKILARELNKKNDEICYDSKDSNIMKYETKVGGKNGK